VVLPLLIKSSTVRADVGDPSMGRTMVLDIPTGCLQHPFRTGRAAKLHSNFVSREKMTLFFLR
jgi:hypothetical protein